MEIISSVYANYIEPISTPWGHKYLIDQFSAFLLVNNYLVNGVISLYNSKIEQNSNEIIFDLLQFEDNLSEDHRLI
ncbi:hypothetical protein MXB_2113, partial [Myxobolus squamalis]